jgi:Tfp pilus assembly protein PilV
MKTILTIVGILAAAGILVLSLMHAPRPSSSAAVQASTQASAPALKLPGRDDRIRVAKQLEDFFLSSGVNATVKYYDPQTCVEKYEDAKMNPTPSSLKTWLRGAGCLEDLNNSISLKIK